MAGSSSIAGYSGAQCAGGSSCVPNWSVESWYAVASKPSAANVYGCPVSGFSVGLKLDAPKPDRGLDGGQQRGGNSAREGWNGVSVWVRSM